MRLFSTGISENEGQSSQKLHYRENWRAWCSTRINEIVQASHRDAEDCSKRSSKINHRTSNVGTTAYNRRCAESN